MKKTRRGAIEASEPLSGSGKAALAAALLGAAALRLAYIWRARSDIFSAELIVDAKFYHEWALRILAGDWLGREVFYQDPLYAYFLAACYKLLGAGYFGVRAVQALLDLGTLGLVFHIARRAFGVRAGLIAAALGALYGPMVYYTGLLDKTTLSAFLAALSLALFLEARRLPERVGRFALAGLAFGVAALTRGNMLLVAAALALWPFARRAGEIRASSLKSSAAFLAGALAVVGAIAARNRAVGGDFVLLSANAGLNFFLGNNAHTPGNYVEPPFLRGIPEEEYRDSKSAAERALGRGLSRPSEVSGFWLRQGLAFIIQRPGAWLALLARKAYLLFHRFEIPETYSFDYFKESVAVLRLAPLGYFGLLGLALLGARRAWTRPSGRVLLAFEAAYGASLLLFFITSRYRFPLVPGMLALAGGALDGLLGAWERSGARGLARPAAAAGIFVLLFAREPSWLEPAVLRPGRSTPHTIKGLLLQERGEVAASIAELEKARALYPSAANVHGYLGRSYAAVGESAKARAAYLEAVRLDPFFHEVYNNLAALHYREGRPEAALEAMERALALKPDEPRYRLHRENLLKLLGRGSATRGGAR